MAGRGKYMTIIETAQRPAAHDPQTRNRYGADGRRPGRGGPAGHALVYRGTGVTVSRAPHRRRPVSIAVTMALAGVAALITFWLGAFAHAGGIGGRAPAQPEQLAVVQVHAGENLQRLAARVAPDAPVDRVVERIRELNQLPSSALDAGQTLIAPVS